MKGGLNVQWLASQLARVVRCIVSSYCKTNDSSLKNLYIEKRFISNLVSAATMHLFILPIAVDTKYNDWKWNNNT